MKNAILIVDDSRLNRETLADILKDKYNICLLYTSDAADEL